MDEEDDKKVPTHKDIEDLRYACRQRFVIAESWLIKALIDALPMAEPDGTLVTPADQL